MLILILSASLLLTGLNALGCDTLAYVFDAAHLGSDCGGLNVDSTSACMLKGYGCALVEMGVNVPLYGEVGCTGCFKEGN